MSRDDGYKDTLQVFNTMVGQQRAWLDMANRLGCSDLDYSILGVLPANPASTFYAALFESESIGARRANALDRLNEAIDRLVVAMGPLGKPFLRLLRSLR